MSLRRGSVLTRDLLQVHLDAMDVAGDNQLNVEHEMVKQRLSSRGAPIGKAGVEIIGEVRRLRAADCSH